VCGFCGYGLLYRLKRQGPPLRGFTAKNELVVF